VYCERRFFRVQTAKHRPSFGAIPFSSHTLSTPFPLFTSANGDNSTRDVFLRRPLCIHSSIKTLTSLTYHKSQWTVKRQYCQHQTRIDIHCCVLMWLCDVMEKSVS
jgi:hypothetical protein